MFISALLVARSAPGVLGMHFFRFCRVLIGGHSVNTALQLLSGVDHSRELRPPAWLNGLIVEVRESAEIKVVEIFMCPLVMTLLAARVSTQIESALTFLAGISSSL